MDLQDRANFPLKAVADWSQGSPISLEFSPPRPRIRWNLRYRGMWDTARQLPGLKLLLSPCSLELLRCGKNARAAGFIALKSLRRPKPERHSLREWRSIQFWQRVHRFPNADLACRRFDEQLVQINRDRDPVIGILTVIQIIALVGVSDIHVVVIIPIVRPVFWPRIHETEPKAAILEARIPTVDLHGVPVEAERVFWTKITPIAVVGNAVAVVSTTVPPGAVLGLPILCAMLLPNTSLFTLLHALTLL